MTTTEDLGRVMALLGVEEEPLYVLRDHDRDRGYAELYARVAAAATDGCRRAEAIAGLSVDEAADLHVSADLEAGGGRLADLQRARICWAQHVIERGRGARSDVAADAVITTLGAVDQLFDSGPDLDAQVTDALIALGDAANHLVSVLRAASRH